MQEKLCFYYSAMKGGKTSRIFSKIHDLEEIGQKAKMTIENKFTWDKLSDKFIDIYEKIIKNYK